VSAPSPPRGELPAGFEVRAVTLADVEAITDLVNEVSVAEIGFPWTNADETLDDLTAPGRDGGKDDAILVGGDGRVVGYLGWWGDQAPFTQMEVISFVTPALWGRGLNAWLLRLGEERARAKVKLAPAGERVVLRVARFSANEPAGRLFAALGFTYVRTFWMMRIELDRAPPEPRLPDGIGLRPFRPGVDERPVYEALAEAFADHWGGPFPAFDDFRHLLVEGAGSGFDPGLWFLAVDGDDVVGAACCRAGSPRDPDAAHVNELGVRRPWRGRGIGLALLHAAFGELHRRGIPRAELAVDAANPTGATRLYERAGMKVAYSWEFWEKELRPAGG
jgi:mycothiol synthase